MDKPESEHFVNGLAARLLLAYPPRVAKRWSEADIEESIRAAVASRFDCDGNPPTIGALDERGEVQFVTR